MSVEAEMSVLGCAILDRKCAQEAADALAPEMFRNEITRRVFQKLLDLYWAGKPIDAVLLATELPEDKVTIVKLAQYVPSLNHFREYVKIVQDEWQMENLLVGLKEIEFAGGALEDVVAKLKELAAEQERVLSLRDSTGITTISQAMQELAKWLRETERKETVSSGFPNLDYATGGFLRKSVFALSARSGGGKTDYALNLALRMGKRGYKVLYCTMEMPSLQLMQRAASFLIRIDGSRIRDKDLSDLEIRQVEAIVGELEKSGKIGIIEEPRLSVKRVRHHIDLMKPDVVFIDHIGLMERPNLKDQYRALGMVSNQLKQLALEKDIAVVELVQMNRQIEGRSSKKPNLSDLRESGDIEQDSDYVGFLVPEEQDAVLTGDAWTDVTLYLEKNRHGRRGKFQYHWQPQYHRFTEVENRYG